MVDLGYGSARGLWKWINVAAQRPAQAALRLTACNDGKLPRLRVTGCSGDVGMMRFDHKAARFELLLQRRQIEILQPVIDLPGARRFHDRITIKHHLVRDVLKDIQKAEVGFGGPEPLQQVFFITHRLFARGKPL